MIIYCTGAKRGNESFIKLYKDLISLVENLGITVLAELSNKFISTIPLTDNQIYKRNLKWIDGSKIVIAEVSGPCLEVGFEIAYAIYDCKTPVLAIHTPDSAVPRMLSGCDSPLLTIHVYRDTNELKSIIENFISKNS